MLGAIAYEGSTSLEIYKENLTSPKYTSILDSHIEEIKELYPDCCHYIQDNLKQHVAAKIWIEENGEDIIVVEDFPAYSYDLNLLKIYGLN